MFVIPSLIKMAERATDLLMPSGASAAQYDRDFYDTDCLTAGEYEQAMAELAEERLAEGDIFVVYPGAKEDHFEIVTPEAAAVPMIGRDRGTAVASAFEAFLASARHRARHPGRIDTVVIPGCGSSPLGAAALGKQVAILTQKPVVALNCGAGIFDVACEGLSGGMLMTPLATLLNAFDPLLSRLASINPVGAKLYIHELIDAIAEAATLSALLKARLVDEGGGLRDRNARGLDMIVSHSKGNWAVLVALLDIEFELGEKISAANSAFPEPIDIVTFGNPVDMPDRAPMTKLFRYHQYVGDCDTLARNCSMRWWQLQIAHGPRLDPIHELGTGGNAFDPNGAHAECLFANTQHHLFAKTDPETPPYHMPIEKILPLILKARSPH